MKIQNLNEMTYKELVEQLSDDLGLDPAEARGMTDQVLSGLIRQLQEGNGFTIPGLGTFRVRERESRSIYSPWHGEKRSIPSRRQVSFTPARRLRERLNQLGRQK